MGLVGRERERKRRVRAARREPHPVHDREPADGGRRGRRAVPDRERPQEAAAAQHPQAAPGQIDHDPRPRPAQGERAQVEMHDPAARAHGHERRAPRALRARAPAPTPARRTASVRPPARRACAAAAAASPSDRCRGRCGRAGTCQTAGVCVCAAGRRGIAEHGRAGAPPPMPRHRRCTHRRPRRPRPRPETPSRKAYVRRSTPAVSCAASDDAPRVDPLGGSLWGTPRGTGVTTHRIACASLRLRRRSAHAGQGQSGRVAGRRRMTQWGRTQRARVARATAAAFLDGDWEPAGMAARAATAFGRRPRWLAGVAAEAAASYRERPADRPRELAAVIERALDRLDARRPAPAAAAACADGGLRAGDGADALAGARARHPGRPGRDARPAPWRARLAGRPPRAGAARPRPAAAQLPLPLAAPGRGAAAPDRAAQAPAQGDPAAAAARDPRGDPAARRRPRLPPRALAAHACPPPHRPRGRAAVRPGGLLRLDPGRSRVRRLPRRRLSGGGRGRPHRARHERAARRGVGGGAAGGRPGRRSGAPPPGAAARRRRICRRAPPPRPRSPTCARIGSTAASPGWPTRSTRPTPATRTTWCSRAGRACTRAPPPCGPRSRRSSSPRASG